MDGEKCVQIVKKILGMKKGVDFPFFMKENVLLFMICVDRFRKKSVAEKVRTE